MAAIVKLVLNDGTSDVTFNPASKSGNMVTWVSAATSVALQPRIVSDAKNLSSSATNRKVKYTVALPFVDTSVNDVRSYKTGYVNIDFNLPRVMTSADVKKIRMWLSNLMENAVILDQIDNGSNPY